ncbi:MAG: enoyl-CoA hydratase/isomerase family protein [Microthrixaceae bacterium]|nr:enoyl-CoA hydratase/isomerase family protein [Microthrixaceae bacterium]
MSDADAPLDVERTDDDVVIATLRNGKVNALSNRVLGAVAEAAEGWADDPPGAVVLTGGAKLFAAGADIEQFVAADDTDGAAEGAVTLVDGDAVRGIAGAFRRATVALEALTCPVIAEISGYALGGGCELALAADLRIASDRARFGQPEILLGIIPGGGGTQRLARLVGPSRAKDLVFTGRQVDADEALAIGLVNEVVPHDELRTRTLALATSLAVGPRRAIALAKAAISDGIEGGLETGLDLEEQAFVAAFATSDAAVGVGSFRRHGPGKAGFSGR